MKSPIKLFVFPGLLLLVVAGCRVCEDQQYRTAQNSQEWVTKKNMPEMPLSAIYNFMTIPDGAEKFIKAYPSSIIGYFNNYLLLENGQKVLYDDTKIKSNIDMLEYADPQDMLALKYPQGAIPTLIDTKEDPGRYRSDELMRAMYGSTQQEVEENLIVIDWCHKLIGGRVQVTTRNNVHLALKGVSDELDKHPEWVRFVNAVGTYNWRPISHTNRLSAHSFGIAIDLSTAQSNYWLWENPHADETTEIGYYNKIPQGIVDIFEKHGFIWGGRWYHYDTMHFEYRPELL